MYVRGFCVLSNAYRVVALKKTQKVFKSPQNTTDAVRQKIVVVENICLFVRIAITFLLQANLGIVQVGV